MIGMFDADQCQRAIEICSPVFDKIIKKAGGQ
jgi:hypothetical protein